MPRETAISVIIPTWNEEQHIARAILSAQAASEVVVVDCGSTDATKSIAESNGAIVVEAEQGRGTQLASGARRSTGEVLIFLHADSWLGEHAIVQLRELSSRHTPERTYGCFRQRIDDRRFRFRILESGNAFRARWMRTPYGDQAVFVSRSLYDLAEGFANVPLMEDVIFAQRMRKLRAPTILPGPVHLSARRWQSKGVVAQTIRNWLIFSAFQCGVSPKRLAAWYR